MSKGRILERVDSIPWATLTHAYGTAADVPAQLKGLISDDERVREKSLHELFGNIWHQHTIYEATAYAVPFLIEIIADKSLPDRFGALTLLTFIASGQSYIQQHECVLKTTLEDPSMQKRLTEELRWVQSAYDAVVAGTQNYLTLVADDDIRIRILSAYLLGYLRNDCEMMPEEIVFRVQEGKA